MAEVNLNNHVWRRINVEINHGLPTHGGGMLQVEGGLRFKTTFYVLPLKCRRPRWDEVQLLSLCYCLDDVRQQIGNVLVVERRCHEFQHPLVIGYPGATTVRKIY